MRFDVAILMPTVAVNQTVAALVSPWIDTPECSVCELGA